MKPDVCWRIIEGFPETLLLEVLKYQDCIYLLGLAALAQLVERLTRNEKVEGSIPSGGSNKKLIFTGKTA